jgi:hypothetical protein
MGMDMTDGPADTVRLASEASDIPEHMLATLSCPLPSAEASAQSSTTEQRRNLRQPRAPEC